MFFFQWEMPIPIYNTLMKLPQTPQRELVYLYIAKAVELAQAKVSLKILLSNY